MGRPISGETLAKQVRNVIANLPYSAAPTMNRQAGALQMEALLAGTVRCHFDAGVEKGHLQPMHENQE
jgi:hypothetical protein